MNSKNQFVVRMMPDHTLKELQNSEKKYVGDFGESAKVRPRIVKNIHYIMDMSDLLDNTSTMFCSDFFF